MGWRGEVRFEKLLNGHLKSKKTTKQCCKENYFPSRVFSPANSQSAAEQRAAFSDTQIHLGCTPFAELLQDVWPTAGQNGEEIRKQVFPGRSLAQGDGDGREEGSWAPGEEDSACQLDTGTVKAAITTMLTAELTPSVSPEDRAMPRESGPGSAACLHLAGHDCVWMKLLFSLQERLSRGPSFHCPTPTPTPWFCSDLLLGAGGRPHRCWKPISALW